MKLNTPVTELPKVGKTTAMRLGYLGIAEAGDLLRHVPFRYDDYSQTKKIHELKDGEEVTVLATVALINAKRSARKKMVITEAVVEDDTSQMKIVWFRQPYIAKQLKVGDKVYFSGKVSDSMYGLQMKAPSFEKVIEGEGGGGRIVPVYPTTAGLTQKQIRSLVSKTINLADQLEDWVPESMLDKVDGILLSEALRGVHLPDSQEHLSEAIRRMKFDELLLHQLRAERIRQETLQGSAITIPFEEAATQKFVASLPFELTKDQKISSWQILQDLEKDVPMNRLLEGDVGSGKTAVAALVSHAVQQSGRQIALMAPTSILAEQHFSSFCEMFPRDMVIALKTGDTVKLHNYTLTEKTKAGQKREFLALLAKGDIDIAIGTHALISTGVIFNNLALTIVDEQHRFGVAQRKKIKEQSGNTDTIPHFLSMTATPIPRSYALALYGELEISMIKTMPAGRKPVNTKRIQEAERRAAYSFIREQIGEGRQAFVICPMIDAEGEQAEEKKTVLAEYEKLSTDVFADLRVTYVHGKMKAKEKDEIMNAFSRKEYDVLVSTSVIEVGVNVPNASVMMIESAERFGLAQLHQFRGRVGRSIHQSYCFLFSDSMSMVVRDRLDFFCSTTDGFKVAEYDLELRGPGEVYGTQQSGDMNFKFASLRDTELISTAQECVKNLDFAQYSKVEVALRDFELSLHLE